MNGAICAPHLCVVLQTGPGHVVVDSFHTGMVADKGCHLGGSALDTVYGTRFDSGIQE